MIEIEGIGSPVALSLDSLARHSEAIPADALRPEFRTIADALARPGERLPLVIRAAEANSYRAAVSVWIDGQNVRPLARFLELSELVERWDGRAPAANSWIKAQDRAQAEAKLLIDRMAATARARQSGNAARQVEAAKLRLRLELGRYLACAASPGADLNQVLYQQMRQQTSTATRLRRAYDRLGAYPDWEAFELAEMRAFRDRLIDSQIRARLIGRELEAALDDPRWGTVL